MTEKQHEYLADLIQINLINRTWAHAGLTGEQARRLQDEIVRRLRAEIEAGEVDGGRASDMIDAAKRYPHGPRKALVTVGLTERDEVARVIKEEPAG